MTHPFYDFTVYDEAHRFEFDSIGKKVIPKVIVLSSTDLPRIYSLTLANLLADGSLDDTTVSDNGDMEKILATVFQCMAAFLDDHPTSIVAFAGSSESRTRLYQIAIARELEEASNRFNIWGLTQDVIEPFQRSKAYDGFMVSLKSVNIDW